MKGRLKMRNFLIIISKYFLGVFGIVLISSTPVLFTLNDVYNLHLYSTTVWEVIKYFFNPSEWKLNYFVPSSMEIKTFSYLDYLKGPYLYSMPIFIISLLLSLLVSFIFSISTMLSKELFKRNLLQGIKIIESIPDFSFIFLLQIIVVQIYLKTNHIVLNFYSLGNDIVYLAPILCLSILPTLLFLKLFVLLYEEEWAKPYVDLAKSKGLSNFEILIKHCTSNVLKSLFFQSKSIVWLTLSSLVIIEYLFGINGTLYYLMNDFSPKGTTFILLSIFTPFFIFYSLIESIVNKDRVERNVIFEKFNFSFLDFQQIRSLFGFKKKPELLKIFKISKRSFSKRLHIIIPVFIVLGLLFTSFLYYILFDDQIDQINFIYNDKGKIVSQAPHPPSSSVLFGTDPYGYSIFQQLLVGIKYTILITLIIATIRIVTGYLFSIIYVFYFNNKNRKIINAIADGMHFLPLTLLVFILLTPILINVSGVWETSLMERLILQILIMSIIVLPVTTSAIGNEMNETLKKEYIQSSVVMGGSLIWILLKHINPQLWSKIVLLWTQHVIQVLQMFVHLGILSVFVGGAAYYADTPNRLIPTIYELSGMIAISREVFMTKQYWMILPPLLAFMLLIYCFNTIANGISKKPIYTLIKK